MRRFLSNIGQELQGGVGQQGGGGYGGYPQQPGGGGFGGFGGFGGGGFNQAMYGTPPVGQATTPCPRKQAQVGLQDWIGLGNPQFSAFNMCPTCYNTHVRSTPYASAFVTKAGAIAVPPHVAVRCDMGRFWVRTAGMVLLTMNQDGRHDITLLARAAAVRAQDGECPNAQLASEQQPLVVARRATWYTIQDPQTGTQPLPGWTVCASCAFSIQTCCPAIAAGLAPVQPAGSPRDSSCALVPSDYYDDTRTAQILQQVGGCAVTAAMTRRPDLSQLVNWLRANLPPLRGGNPVSTGVGGPQQPDGLCPRNYPSTTLKCHTMQGLFDFTVCEQCYGDVIKPDADNGIDLARRFDMTASSVPGPGFTCQLYSDRMRRVWRDAASTGDMEHLRQKVSERRAKERELQMKTAQLQQQAAQLRIQASTQEHLAINAMRVATSAASNNIMLSGVGAGYRVEGGYVYKPSGVADFSQTTQLNNQAAMLKVQAGQAEDQIRMAVDEWKRFWE